MDSSDIVDSVRKDRDIAVTAVNSRRDIHKAITVAVLLFSYRLQLAICQAGAS